MTSDEAFADYITELKAKLFFGERMPLIGAILNLAMFIGEVRARLSSLEKPKPATAPPPGWTRALVYTCSNSGARVTGSLGFYGESTDSIPQGWLRARHEGGRELYACSAECAAKAYAPRKEMP